MSGELKQGICFECGKPLENKNSFGYHWQCAEIAHERSSKEADEKFPFVVIDFYENEIDGFATEEEAEEFLNRMKYAEIKNLNKSV